ncbi:hypothetical protein ACVGVM_01740 [Pseudonocardia bannensis]|uniref:Uncharacterized protein n=1 Tax=Pseudonocardia bannensis TaxID=630973 RepID=A0A848DR72_9PSEU|nr:hypothetical protein [Pseudonocardia bannensis]NMH94794.1 hypothetical protein [Pseudonocardia bannensis]
MHWLFTGLLIAASGSVVAFTGHLLHKLFTTEPAPVFAGPADAPTEAGR